MTAICRLVIGPSWSSSMALKIVNRRLGKYGDLCTVCVHKAERCGRVWLGRQPKRWLLFLSAWRFARPPTTPAADDAVEATLLHAAIQTLLLTFFQTTTISTSRHFKQLRIALGSPWLHPQNKELRFQSTTPMPIPNGKLPRDLGDAQHSDPSIGMTFCASMALSPRNPPALLP